MSLHTVLLVEDDPADQALVRIASASWKGSTRLDVVDDMQAALTYLRESWDQVSPLLVLTDLNMPLGNGFELIEAIRDDDALCTVPVVVLTTATADRSVRRAYAVGANAYHSKPMSIQELRELLQHILTYWGDTTHLPHGGRAE